METISFIMQILLSLTGYSVGVVLAGKSAGLKPGMTDLILVSLIWAGSIYSRMALDLNRWLLILAWVVFSAAVGMLVMLYRRPARKEAQSKELREMTSANFFRKMWQRWGYFSKKMGGFQSRILISLFYFIFVSPFAVGLKMAHDPLQLRNKGGESHWIPRTRTENNLEQFRRQF